MSPKELKNDPVFEWPLWAEAYALVVAGPLTVVSMGLMVWLVLRQRDTLTDGYIGPLLIIIAFLSSFFIAALLFLDATRRVLNKKAEALSYASSAHLMLTLPAATYLLVGFFQEREFFINDLVRVFHTGEMNIDALLLVWLILHTYFALVLALADHTSRYLYNQNA
jgi:hypothetical protein